MKADNMTYAYMHALHGVSERILSIEEFKSRQVSMSKIRKFLFAVGKNYNKINSYVVVWNKVVQKDKPLQKYNSARDEVEKSMAMRDDNGKPVRINGVLVMESPVAFKQAVENLLESDEFKEAYEAHQVELDTVVRNADGEPLSMHAIKLSWIPPEILGVVMKTMGDFVEFDEEDDGIEKTREVKA